jgi:hypothetical protein
MGIVVEGAKYTDVRLFNRHGAEVAKVPIPDIEPSPYGIILYQGRIFILEAGRFVERPIWNAS